MPLFDDSPPPGGEVEVPPQGYFNMVLFPSNFDPDQPRLCLYGDPEGLRFLARLLIEQANEQQGDGTVGPDEGDHHKLAPHGGGGVAPVLHPMSHFVSIGRLDRPSDGSFDWVLDGLDPPLPRLQKQWAAEEERWANDEKDEEA